MLKDYYIPLTRIRPKLIQDEFGSYWVDLSDEIEILGGFWTSSSNQLYIAEKNEVQGSYNFIISTEYDVKFGDIIKINSTNKFYKITVNPTENQIPGVSSLNYYSLNAISYEVQND